MAESIILSGKTVSQHVYQSLIPRIDSLQSSHIKPGLAVILIGNNPASQIYVNSKARRFELLGLHSETFRFPVDIGEKMLISFIHELNDNPSFHGILVQMPIPKHLNESTIIEAISPQKDVDGFHPDNLGRLTAGIPRFIPCTPKGIMRILRYYKIDPTGQHVVIIGRSQIVGRPISILMSLKQSFSNATTTLCHSGTTDISNYTLQGDIIIVAMGNAEFLKEDDIKKGVVLIDVGINRVEDDSEKGYHLVGDVDFHSVKDKAKAITPVPGGVGPMTIAMLVENTVEAAELVSGE